MTWFVYVLSCGDGTYYTGITNDLEKRFLAHCQGRGAKYTKGRMPLEIVYQECFDDRSQASKRECSIKSLTRNEKEKMIRSSGIFR